VRSNGGDRASRRNQRASARRNRARKQKRDRERESRGRDLAARAPHLPSPSPRQAEYILTRSVYTRQARASTQKVTGRKKRENEQKGGRPSAQRLLARARLAQDVPRGLLGVHSTGVARAPAAPPHDRRRRGRECARARDGHVPAEHDVLHAVGRGLVERREVRGELELRAAALLRERAAARDARGVVLGLDHAPPAERGGAARARGVARARHRLRLARARGEHDRVVARRRRDVRHEPVLVRDQRLEHALRERVRGRPQLVRWVREQARPEDHR
jgi:hypothetical protein